jgi:hypothetical protein
MTNYVALWGHVPPIPLFSADYPVHGEVNLSACLAGGFFAALYGDPTPSIQ